MKDHYQATYSGNLLFYVNLGLSIGIFAMGWGYFRLQIFGTMTTYSILKSYSGFNFINTKYFHEWFPYDYYQNYEDLINQMHCPRCNFEPANDNPSSTPRDILLSSMFGNIANLIPCSRSLRTTGSRATFFILTDNNTFSMMTPDSIKIINGCGLYVINLGVCEKLTPRIFFALRHLIYYNFLFPRQHLMDRVIMMDLYDSIFQGDPFPDYFERDTLYFCSENLTFSRSRGNRKWLRTIVHDDLLRYYPKHIVNGGTILGSVSLIIKYLELFMIYVDMTRLQFLKADDQAYTNFFAYSGILAKHQIKHKILDLSDFIVCVHGMQYYPGDWRLGKYVTPIGKKPHLVVHQFDRSKMMKFNVYIACPRDEMNVTRYMRGITDEEFEMLNDFVKNGSFYDEPFKKLHYINFEA
ncbi:hypothetical protein TRFO_27622 [Tritrichomonas foetus]|uniref:Uncharacterized protein n=1 Tax=Tritrichomonas foetus TaxID=1144522 RepID=A0A1J4K579_9EUKA|nr:hypothetical protein TRFO_27622 [Tritrichomonas foetus]|eukprot:OHT04830.1 hypothetical protein TRFO_27622 [Tritrichomonas foetus]